MLKAICNIVKLGCIIPVYAETNHTCFQTTLNKRVSFSKMEVTLNHPNEKKKLISLKQVSTIVFWHLKMFFFQLSPVFHHPFVGFRPPNPSPKAPHQTVPVATPLRPSRPSSAKVSQKRAAVSTARKLSALSVSSGEALNGFGTEGFRPTKNMKKKVEMW